MKTIPVKDSKATQKVWIVYLKDEDGDEHTVQDYICAVCASESKAEETAQECFDEHYDEMLGALEDLEDEDEIRDRKQFDQYKNHQDDVPYWRVIEFEVI